MQDTAMTSERTELLLATGKCHHGARETTDRHVFLFTKWLPF